MTSRKNETPKTNKVYKEEENLTNKAKGFDWKGIIAGVVIAVLSSLVTIFVSTFIKTYDIGQSSRGKIETIEQQIVEIKQEIKEEKSEIIANRIEIAVIKENLKNSSEKQNQK